MNTEDKAALSGLKTTPKQRAEEIERRYQRALAAIRLRFGNKGHEAEKYYENLLGSDTFFRSTFFQGLLNDPDKKVSFKEKLAIIAAEEGRSGIVPRHILRVVSKEPDLPLESRYDKFYRYFRHIPTGGVGKFMRWGLIHLKTVPGEGTIFRHWSYDHLEDIGIREGENLKGEGHEALRGLPDNAVEEKHPLSWEDEGYAFYTPQRFFLIGFRTHNIRLSVSTSIKPDEDLSKVKLHGIMLTTTKGSHVAFSAAFVMVHESNPQFFTSMTPTAFAELVRKDVESDKFLIRD